MNKLLGLFRGHRPDMARLSAYLDGQLAPAASARLEAHIATCGTCRERLSEMRGLLATLRGLGEVEPRRSFRLRPADLAAPAPVPTRAAPARLRFSSAMSAAVAATALLVMLVAVDALGGGGGGGDDEAARGAGALRVMPEVATPDAAAAADRFDSGSSAPGATPPAASEAAPSVAADAEQAKGSDEVEAASRDAYDGDGGGIDGLLVAEVAAAAVALAAAAAALAARMRRSR